MQPDSAEQEQDTEVLVQTITVGDLAQLAQGRDALEAGNYVLANEKFSAVIKLMPFYPLAHVQRAQALLGLGMPDPALADLDEAIRLDIHPAIKMDSREVESLFHLGESLETAHVLRARALAEKGDMRGAISACDQGLSVAPGSTALLRVRASLKFKIGDAEGAKADEADASRLSGAVTKTN